MDSGGDEAHFQNTNSIKKDCQMTTKRSIKQLDGVILAVQYCTGGHASGKTS